MCEFQQSLCVPQGSYSLSDGIELMIIVTSTFAQAIAGSGPTIHIVGVITLWRFIMGIGIGGDYPLSAVIASEFASTRSRGRLMTAVFASQGWGYLGKRSSPYSHGFQLTGGSFYNRNADNYQRLSIFHRARPAHESRSFGLLLANPHRCWLYPGRLCTVFQAHNSRDTSLHYGYRT